MKKNTEFKNRKESIERHNKRAKLIRTIMAWAIGILTILGTTLLLGAAGSFDTNNASSVTIMYTTFGIISLIIAIINLHMLSEAHVIGEDDDDDDNELS